VFEKEFSDATEKNKDVSSFRIFEDMLAFTSLFSELESLLYPSFDELWNHHFSSLEKFFAAHNRFPMCYESFEGFQLGSWAATQKSLAKSPNYPKDRYEKLKEIGFFDITKDFIWRKKYDLLLDFIKENGRFPKQRENYQGVELGTWCATQKMRLANGKLTPEEQAVLDSIGLFNDTLAGRWNQKYQLLQEFIAENNRVPHVGEVYKGVNIGSWVTKQKGFKNLSPERHEKLTALGIFEDSIESKWDRAFSYLQAFVAEYHRLPHRSEVYQDFPVGIWVARVRGKAKKSENFPDVRRKKLESVGVFLETNYRSAMWDRNFALLEQFYQEHSHFPSQSETYQGVNIGNWYSHQIKQVRKGNYPQEHLEKLKLLGVDFSNAYDAAWERNFALIKQFINEEGRLPKRYEIYQGVALGGWLSYQKSRIKSGTCSPDKQQKLEDLGVIPQKEQTSSSVISPTPQHNSLDAIIAAAHSKSTPRGGSGPGGMDGPGGR